MRRFAVAWLFLFVAGAQAPLHAQNFSCTRHVYNNTSCTWYVLFVPGGQNGVAPSGVSVGGSCVTCGVPFQTRDRGTVKVCRLQPGCTGQINYVGDRDAFIGGWAYVGRSTIDYRQFEYRSQVLFGGTCPTIQSDGPVPFIALNAPANGDISIVAGGPCPAPTPPPLPRPVIPPRPGPPTPCYLGLCP